MLKGQFSSVVASYTIIVILARTWLDIWLTITLGDTIVLTVPPRKFTLFFRLELTVLIAALTIARVNLVASAESRVTESSLPPGSVGNITILKLLMFYTTSVIRSTEGSFANKTMQGS